MKNFAYSAISTNSAYLIWPKCSVLRSRLTNIFQTVWTTKIFPDVWESGAAVLAYRKGDAGNPENFHPITLKPVLSKVFTSNIRNRLFNFASKNKYIEKNLQKGFWEKTSGCIEYIECLSHIINNARLKQRGCVVTLLDLKNAFGEVSHNLLIESLKIHDLPAEIIQLITSLYSNYDRSILTDNFVMSPIKVQRGVLQGDSPSPLLFNLTVNTLINTVKSEKVEYMGYVYQGCLSPKHWFQFADDITIVTALGKDNQLLCNGFMKWTTWTDLIVRDDKCHTFGIKKTKTKSDQFQPFIRIRNKRIPPIENGKSFTYLGKDFNCSMNCDEIKTELTK